MASRTKLKPDLNVECAHHRRHDWVQMGYIEWDVWAKARIRRGERQSQCPDCKRWLFADEVGCAPL